MVDDGVCLLLLLWCCNAMGGNMGDMFVWVSRTKLYLFFAIWAVVLLDEKR